MLPLGVLRQPHPPSSLPLLVAAELPATAPAPPLPPELALEPPSSELQAASDAATENPTAMTQSNGVFIRWPLLQPVGGSKGPEREVPRRTRKHSQGQLPEVTVWPVVGTPLPETSAKLRGMDWQLATPQFSSRITWAWGPVE